MILNGWKEIANHMGRGVRTVQRWEALGLPIHRPNSRLRSAVVTTSDEVDRWLITCVNGRTTIVTREYVAETPLSAELAKTNRLLAEMEQFRAQNKAMREAMVRIRTQSQNLREKCLAYGVADAALRRISKPQ